MQKIQICDVIKICYQLFEKCQTLHRVSHNLENATSCASLYGHPSKPQQIQNNKLCQIKDS